MRTWSESSWSYFTKQLLVEHERERHVDDGEVVDGEAAENADKEEIQGLLETERLEPKNGTECVTDLV